MGRRVLHKEEGPELKVLRLNSGPLDWTPDPGPNSGPRTRDPGLGTRYYFTALGALNSMPAFFSAATRLADFAMTALPSAIAFGSASLTSA